MLAGTVNTVKEFDHLEMGEDSSKHELSVDAARGRQNVGGGRPCVDHFSAGNIIQQHTRVVVVQLPTAAYIALAVAREVVH